MADFQELRETMVQTQLEPRGISDPAVIEAMETIPREEFVPENLAEFAYDDSPLPIGLGQTISQPYVVAAMAEALKCSRKDRILEIGTGSGYAAAVLSLAAGEVFTVERHQALAEAASERFKRLGYKNIHVLHGDGSLGWLEHAPYNGIIVSAGSPSVPEELKKQLAVGGRLVIPTGSTSSQQLILIRRESEDHYEQEELFPVRFVPLVGEAGWREPHESNPHSSVSSTKPVSQMIAKTGDIIPSIRKSDISPLLDRIGDSKIVLLGESTHGTAEFYEMRARITRELIEQKEFTIVALEADWPDGEMLDRYIKGITTDMLIEQPFSYFPSWRWKNREFTEFIESLRSLNLSESVSGGIGIYGLDLYSRYLSTGTILKYLERLDPEIAQTARTRYGFLTPWQKDPEIYKAAALSQPYKQQESEITAFLTDLLEKRLNQAFQNEARFRGAVKNDRVMENAETYYRALFYGTRKARNLRDLHMFETLNMLLDYHGPDSRAVVWGHNSHIGDWHATDMGVSGERNLGVFCREAFGLNAYLIGFGTHHGTVCAASGWDQPCDIMNLNPSLENSFEYICHQSEIPAFMLALRYAPERIREAFDEPRLERAIGTVYSSDGEERSHYFHMVPAREYDDYIWFNETRAIKPLND